MTKPIDQMDILKSYIIIAQRIAGLRLKEGLNKREAADAINIKYTTYIDYEKGLYPPSSENLDKIARFYKVSLEYLLGRTDDPETKEKKQEAEDELADYLEMLRTRPEMRVLLDTVKGATKEEVEANVKFIEALRKGGQG